jgi:hypothetical protein
LLFLEYALAAGRSQHRKLPVEILVGGGNPSVANAHAPTPEKTRQHGTEIRYN